MGRLPAARRAQSSLRRSVRAGATEAEVAKNAAVARLSSAAYPNSGSHEPPLILRSATPRKGTSMPVTLAAVLPTAATTAATGTGIVALREIKWGKSERQHDRASAYDQI